MREALIYIKNLDHLINYEHFINKIQAGEIKQITDLNVFIVSKINHEYGNR